VLTKLEKLSLKGQPAGFSGLTTGLLHWLTGPYVHALEYLPRTQQLDVHTLSVLCRPVHTRVHLAEVRLGKSALALCQPWSQNAYVTPLLAFRAAPIFLLQLAEACCVMQLPRSSCQCK